MGRTALIVVVGMSIALAMGQPLAADDGLRSVDVKRFGISVRVPEAWSLVDWARNEHAFRLSVPQDAGSKVGEVACQLGVAPANLQQFHKQHQADDEREQKSPNPRRKLIENQIEPLDPVRYGKETAKAIGQRLVSVWRYEAQPKQPLWYEVRVRLVSHDTLYTFSLTSDEAHYQSYRLDFEDMLAGAKFSPPETGLQRLPSGYWLQRDFRFALQLPADWQPAFAPHDKVLFFATGERHAAFTDNLLVLASPAEPLDLPGLKQRYAESLAKTAPEATVESCEIVPHGGWAALETVIHTKRGPFEISVLERRFRGERRNYEVKFTCDTATFKKLLPQLRKSLDSFRELQEAPEKTIL